jgi:hypothetical protein
MRAVVCLARRKIADSVHWPWVTQLWVHQIADLEGPAAASSA